MVLGAVSKVAAIGLLAGASAAFRRALVQWRHPENFRDLYYRAEKIRRPDERPTERALRVRNKIHVAMSVVVGAACVGFAIAAFVAG